LTAPRSVAIDLDGALGDTRTLWLDWVASVSALFGLDGVRLPEDRVEAALELDRRGAGNWRTLLRRFSEERAAVYLRRDPATSAALRALDASGTTIGVFTDAPESLARVALAQLGAARRVSVVETGSAALDRLLAKLGSNAVVVRTASELASVSKEPSNTVLLGEK
jgi:phosphoglycolate phosphatase-like HAD superfamily hydrolase